MSFAGQYDSIGNCWTLSEIEQGIRSCLLSLFNPEALAYWQRQGLPEQDFAMAVLIQEQIEPDFSGVCFSLDVATNQDQTMLLEYVKGSAESLVSGQVNPEQLTLLGTSRTGSSLKRLKSLWQSCRNCMPRCWRLWRILVGLWILSGVPYKSKSICCRLGQSRQCQLKSTVAAGRQRIFGTVASRPSPVQI